MPEQALAKDSRQAPFLPRADRRQGGQFQFPADSSQRRLRFDNNPRQRSIAGIDNRPGHRLLAVANGDQLQFRVNHDLELAERLAQYIEAQRRGQFQPARSEIVRERLFQFRQLTMALGIVLRGDPQGDAALATQVHLPNTCSVFHGPFATNDTVRRNRDRVLGQGERKLSGRRGRQSQIKLDRAENPHPSPQRPIQFEHAVMTDPQLKLAIRPQADPRGLAVAVRPIGLQDR